MSRTFNPIRILEIELGEPLQEITPATSRDGIRYPQALALIRLHTVPIGMLTLELDDGSLPADELSRRISAELSEEISFQLAAEGLPLGGGLTPAGLGPAAASTLTELEEFRERAPRLTVLIPSRDRPDRLRRCVDSILACDYPPERRRILVVDNAPSTDETQRLVESYRQAGEPVDYARENAPGSASARNRGLDELDTEIVVMTDDDVLADHLWLIEVARTFAAFPEAACVSGLLMPAEIDSPPQLWFEQYGGFTRGFERRVFDLDENRVDDPLYPWTAGVFGTGNNFSFRTEALREIGGFDPALGNGTPALGGVDSEALLRTILSGHTIIYEPRALVHHAHRPDYDALKRQVYSYGVGLTAYYLKTLLADPRRILDFLRRIPAGLKFLLSKESALNENKEADYPAELERLERKGMLLGPYLYARSRRRYGPHRVPMHRRQESAREPVTR